MTKQTIQVLSWEDKFALAVTVFSPDDDQSSQSERHQKTVVLFNSASGMYQNFYFSFANWLSKQGVSAVTWDYRYSGDSFPPELKRPLSTETRIQTLKSSAAQETIITDHWARRDQPAIVQFVTTRFPSHNLTIIGHSLGGHIIPLIPEPLRSKINRVLMVGAVNPNVNFAPSHIAPAMLRYWKLVIQTIHKEGYLPRSATFFSVIMPAGAGLEWATCISGSDKRYLGAIPHLTSAFAEWRPKNEVISVVWSDDGPEYFDPKTVTDGWCDVLESARCVRVCVGPGDVGEKVVGHTGMFKEGRTRCFELLRGMCVDGVVPEFGEIRRWNQEQVKDLYEKSRL